MLSIAGAAASVAGIPLLGVRGGLPDVENEALLRVMMVMVPACGAVIGYGTLRRFQDGPRSSPQSEAGALTSLFFLVELLVLGSIFMHWATLTAAKGWLLLIALLLWFPAMAAMLGSLVAVPYGIVCMIRSQTGKITT